MLSPEMKGPIILLITAIAAMLGGYVASELFDDRLSLLLSYLVLSGGILALLCGTVWGAYRQYRGKRWRP